ncbi:hypothetical protein NPIL_150291 [Nephila pilipes]|uniref:Uncharacterized protein n=1 Tax=Nephila pilipes TaxID=299642 RepID=A0A8X6U9N9_NEPPI|nr:hypothetical protein NPIL_150291 [Nephila pilipes]
MKIRIRNLQINRGKSRFLAPDQVDSYLSIRKGNSYDKIVFVSWGCEDVKHLSALSPQLPPRHQKKPLAPPSWNRSAPSTFMKYPLSQKEKYGKKKHLFLTSSIRSKGSVTLLRNPCYRTLINKHSYNKSRKSCIRNWQNVKQTSEYKRQDRKLSEGIKRV